MYLVRQSWYVGNGMWWLWEKSSGKNSFMFGWSNMARYLSQMLCLFKITPWSAIMLPSWLPIILQTRLYYVSSNNLPIISGRRISQSRLGIRCFNSLIISISFQMYSIYCLLSFFIVYGYSYGEEMLHCCFPTRFIIYDS